MSEMIDMVVDSATRLFNDLGTIAPHSDTEQAPWPAALWEHAAQAGLCTALDAESDGAEALPLPVLAALARTVGATAAPIPLVETLLGQLALHAAGLPAPTHPLAFGPVLASDRLHLQRTATGWALSGRLRRIPWGRHVGSIVAIVACGASHATVCVPAPAPQQLGHNHAGEPRDDFVFDGLLLDDAAVGAEGRGWAWDRLYFQAALWRAAQMSGAMQTALDLTLRYSAERVQFGRPIGKFQAVQQQVAMMASQVAAAAAAVEAAVAAAADDAPAALAVAAAKARVSEAAGHVVAVAHQVHGAMGFALEHPLHRSTLRLMSWRDEFGSDAEWANWIGRTVADVGADQLWAFVTAPRQFPEANRYRLATHA